MANTHVVETTCKIYLRNDLSGGDRGTLQAGTGVEVKSTDETYKTAYLVAPQKGWVEERFLKPIPTTPPDPDPDPEPSKKKILNAIVNFDDGSQEELVPKVQ